MKSLDSLVDFTGGEVSAKLDARIDSPKYRKALRQALNVIPYKTGGLTRRPGTGYIASAKLSNSSAHNYGVRNESFIFSPTTTFMLEFGNQYIRFYSNGVQVQVTTSLLPSWNNASAYTAGTYVQHDPGTGPQSYYCIASVAGAINPPPFNSPPQTDPTHWSAYSTLEVFSPYNSDYGTSGPQPGSLYGTDIWGLSFEQINDVVWITHPSYPPYTLTRYSDLDWVMAPANFLTPALLDQNATDTQITASATTGNGITLTATAPAWVTANYYNIGNSVEVSGIIYNTVAAHVSNAVFANDLNAGLWVVVNVFNALHVGSTWQMAFLRASAYIETDGTAASGFTNSTLGPTGTVTGISGSPIQCLGDYEVHTYGVWSSDLALQRSLDGGKTWDTVRTVSGRSDRNVDITGTALQLGMYQVVVTNSATLIAPGATNPRVVFECVDAFLYGLVEITAYTDAYHVTANVVTELYATTATEYWSEAAWSNYRGFPAAITTFQQRMIYGGSGYEPQRIWGTVTDDLQNFDLGDQSLATDSFAFDLNAPSRGPIQWLIAQLDLFVGFAGAEWVVNSGSTNANGQSSGAAVTPTSINATESSSWGSAPGVSPQVVGDATFYTQRQTTSIRQILFSVYTEKYMTQDLTSLSDHMFTSGIAQLAYQTRWRKQSIVWVVTQQGTLCGMTYELDQEVFGWHRHQTGYGQSTPAGVPIPPDSGFESVAVLPGKELNDDEVWVVANRLIGGVSVRMIERLNPSNWEETFSGAPNPPAPSLPNAFYVDSGLTIASPGSLTLSGLSYLNGRYVVGLADGNAFGPLLVSGGSVTLPASIPTTVALVQVGLPVYYAAQPMRIDADPRQGNTMGRVKTLDSKFYVRVWNSMGGSISNGTTQYPTWVSGTAYAAGAFVTSPLSNGSFQCVVANSGTLDPSAQANAWSANSTYAVNATAAYYGQLYLCNVAITAPSATPPPMDTSHWAFIATQQWAPTFTPAYMPPVPIPYTTDAGNPFAVPVMVTTPTDKLVPPQLMPSPGADPLFIITGNDALPLTVLALIMQPDIGTD